MNASVWMNCIMYLAFIGLMAQPIGAIVPRSIFSCERFPFRLMRWERGGSVYDKIMIRSWKDKMPDMSRIIGIRKRLTSQVTAAHVDRLVKETCVAELTHWVLIVLGINVLFIIASAVGFLVYLLWSLGNLIFVVIQRYNRPVLMKLAEKLHKREVPYLIKDESVAVGTGGHSV